MMLNKAIQYPIFSIGPNSAVVKVVYSSLSSLSPWDISVGAKQYAVITYLFTPNKTFFNTSSEQPQQLSICYDGEVLTVIDSKRYSQEILGKLENFRQSPNSSKLLLLAQNSQTLQNLRLQRQEKENRI